MAKVIKKQKLANNKSVAVKEVKETIKGGNRKVREEDEEPVDVKGDENDSDEEDINSEDDSEDEGNDSEDDEADSEVSENDQADSESESESETDSETEVPKKKKKNTSDGSESFASAFNNIIGSKLKAHNRSEPIMARNKTVTKKLESDKLESKAKRALLAEKKQLFDRHRVKNLLPGDSEKVREAFETEKKFKKTAQRGVVKLFNAILSTQVTTTQAMKTEKVGEVKKDELFNEMSKEKFLDLVQSASK